MTSLFVRLYLGVLTVLFVAWFIYAAVLDRRAKLDTRQVFVRAHGGGALVIADSLSISDSLKQQAELERIRSKFKFPIVIHPWDELGSDVQRQLSVKPFVAHEQIDEQHFVFAVLEDKSSVVRLGPFPNYTLAAIEASLDGWLQVTAQRWDEIQPNEAKPPTEIAERFLIPIREIEAKTLPDAVRRRIQSADETVFFSRGDEKNFATLRLKEPSRAIEVGPFPAFETGERSAATTTLALVLLPAAFAIALLLQPIARNLRIVERAALKIADGDLSVRISSAQIRPIRSLGSAFNTMADRTEELVKNQQELMQAVSHELRTPVSRIRFAIGLLEDETDEPQRQLRLRSLEDSTDELESLIAELLNYFRIETDSSSDHQELVSIAEAIDDLVPKFEELFPSIQFQKPDFDGKRNLTVAANPLYLNRLIGNLLGNAAKHASQVVAIQLASDDDWIQLLIDDDGPGIPEAERPRVFSPFVRLANDSNSQPNASSGMGLGLSIVKRIVEQLEGTIQLADSPQQGCRVELKLPQKGSGLFSSQDKA